MKWIVRCASGDGEFTAEIWADTKAEAINTAEHEYGCDVMSCHQAQLPQSKLRSPLRGTVIA